MENEGTNYNVLLIDTLILGGEILGAILWLELA